MRLSKKLQIGAQILGAKWSGKKRPLAVGWSLTKRCNFNCNYCGSSMRIGPEMSDEQLRVLAQQMIDAGVQKVAFTGGEPLLRKTIVDLIPLLARNNVSINIDTNGKLLPPMLDKLDGIDGVLLSLDGPEEINDEIRGPGAYRATLDALAAAHEKGVGKVLTCVLSKWNLESFEHVLEVAQRFETSVQFQPAVGTLLGVSEDNPGTPDVEGFRKALDRIMSLKKGQFKAQVGNSISGLTHLRTWPQPRKVRCISGLISARIEPDGAMYHCGRVIASTPQPPNVLDKGFRAAFEKLAPFDCSDCWCAQRVELLLATEINFNVIRNMFSIY